MGWRRDRARRDTDINYGEYTQAIADLLSGDPERMADGNRKLFDEVIEDKAGHHPALALVDAENLLAPVARQGT